MAINIELYRDGLGRNNGANPLGQTGIATWADNFTYAGAFRVPVYLSTGRLDFSEGVIGLNGTSGNMYMSTKSHGICELQIPTPSLSTDITALPIANEVQGELDVFATPDGNPQANDRVGFIYGAGNTIVYAQQKYYDGEADNTTFVCRANGAEDFTTATLEGAVNIAGQYKASGWISELPSNLQSEFGFTHICGNGNNHGIIGRASIGPSAYGINVNDLLSGTLPAQVPTSTFQSFDTSNKMMTYMNPAWTDMENADGTNDVWNHTARVAIGFVVPNTNTFAVFGSLSGASGGLGYKITQPNGHLCGGYCPFTNDDWSFYRWFFDLDDWRAVIQGSKQPHEIAPYEYGAIDLPFEAVNGTESGTGLEMHGGAFDASTNTLYLSVGNNEHRGAYDLLPLVYAINVGG